MTYIPNECFFHQFKKENGAEGAPKIFRARCARAHLLVIYTYFLLYILYILLLSKETYNSLTLRSKTSNARVVFAQFKMPTARVVFNENEGSFLSFFAYWFD